MKHFLLSAMLCCCTLLIFAQGKTTSHKIVKGETLYSISKKYHVSVAAIEKANKITGETKLKLGQSLTIPAASAKAETKTAPTAATDVKSAKSKPATPAADKKATAAEPAKPTATDKKSATSAPARVVSTEKKVTTTTTTTTAKSTKPAADDNPSSHTVAKGESLYSLARTYGVSVKHLREANNMSDETALKTGQKLRIPSKNPEADYASVPKSPAPLEKAAVKSEAGQPGREYLANDNEPVTRKSEKPVEKVAEKIEKKEAEAPKAEPTPVKVTEEKPLTPAVTDKPKEVIKEERAPAPVETKPATPEPVKNTNVTPSDYVTVFNDYGSAGKKKVVYRGIGSFLKSENPGNQYLALYNYADMGAILKVTNLMSKQAIYVKVIGKVPANDAQNDVILKVSGEAATQLKVSEDKFLVEVTGYNGE